MATRKDKLPYPVEKPRDVFEPDSAMEAAEDRELEHAFQSKPGRPRLDPHVKLMRRVYRGYIDYRKAKTLIEDEDKAQEKLLSEGKISKKLASAHTNQYTRAKRKYNVATSELRAYELENNLETTNLDEIISIGDSTVVNSDLTYRVGRPRLDELGYMDERVRYFERKIAEVSKEKDLEGEELEAKINAGRGRPFTQPSERVQRYATDKEAMLAKIKEEEKKLEGYELAERRLKTARDDARLLKKAIKDTEKGIEVFTDIAKSIPLDKLIFMHQEALDKVDRAKNALKEEEPRKKLLEEISINKEKIKVLESSEDPDRIFAISAYKDELEKLEIKLKAISP